MVWFGVNSGNYTSCCGECTGTENKLVEALDGRDMWAHMTGETHWFAIDLGQTYTITKVRGRSEEFLDPTDIDIYVSTSTADWGTAVATGISTWQDTTSWVEVDTTDKAGRYVKVVINATETAQLLNFGKGDTPFPIFDVNVVGDVSGFYLRGAMNNGDFYYDVWCDGTYIYAACHYGGIRAYNFINGDTFRLLDTHWDGAGNYGDMWGDGTYIYVTSGSKINAYTFDGSDFTLAGASASGPTACSDVWGDGTYIYVSYIEGGIRAYTFNGTSFTQVGAQDDGGWQYGIYSDGTYVYVACGSNGVRAYSFNGSIFTLLDTHDAGGSYNSTWSDGTYLYAATGVGGIVAYTFDGDEFALLDTHYDSGNYQHIFSDGVYIYTAAAPSGILAYTFDGTSFTSVGAQDDGGNYKAGWTSARNGAYIYVACDTAGLRAYTFGTVSPESIAVSDEILVKRSTLPLADAVSLTDAIGIGYPGRTYTDSIGLADTLTTSPTLIPRTGYAVYVEGSEYERVYNAFSVTYDDPSIVLSDVPAFEVETDNITGRNINKYSIGKGCKIYRNGSLMFYGVIEPRSFEKSSSGSTMTFGGSHKGYKYLQDRVCDYYRADNNSYAPVVNPWRFGRKIDDTDNTLVDGLRPDEIMECLIGTSFIWQEWFDNHDFLRWTTTQAELVVYDGVLKLPKTASSGDDPDKHATSGYVESIGLYNGDKNVDVMGTITTVTAKLIGTKYSTYNPVLYVCRDADEASPTWSILTTTYDGSGVWTGTTNLAEDGASPTNQFGYYISMNSDGDGSTEVDYARFDCVTASDTSVAAGTIDPYNDPNTADDTIAINLAGMTRLEALEKVRTFTNTSTEYADVNWDAYIDTDLQFHFTTVRGEDIDKTFSFDNKNLTLINQKYDGTIKNALIALGQGEEPYAVTLVGSEMKDTTSIAEYGQNTGYFIDKSIPDAPTLYKRAKAYLKYMKDPRESLEVNICNDPAMSWDVGDRVKINDEELDIDNEYFRVLSRKVTKKQDADEEVDIELGTKSDTVGGLFRNIQDRFSSQEVVTQGTGSPTNTLAAGLVLDTTTAAEYPFYVPANAQRVVMSAKTHKFRAYSKASTAESTHTHTITGKTTGSTAAGMATLWSNPQSRANVAVGANSELNIRCNTVIPSYSGRLFVWCRVHADAGGTLGSAEWTVGDASEPTGWFGEIRWADFTNEDEYMNSAMMPYAMGSGYSGDYLWVRIRNPTDAERTYDVDWWVYQENPHTHSIDGVATGAGSAHTHGLDFGIYEYEYYPAKVSMKIDSLANPVVQKFGYMGATDSSASVVDLDITDNLRDGNGKLVEGLHTLYFSSQSVSPNTEGLGLVAVSHKITVNTAEEVSLRPLP